MTQEASNQLIDKIKVILKGIDQTEIESAGGWWETSTGAKLGAEALKQILELLAQTQELKIKTTDPFESSRVADYNRGWNDCLYASSIVKHTEKEPVAHSVIAGVLFDFMGWLTSRKERIVLSSADNASPAADAIRDFANMRGLSLDDAKVLDWNTTPPQRTWVDLTDEEIDNINYTSAHMLAREVLAKFKEKNT